MQTLNDQVAVVTGAAKGIGKGIAAVLAREGARLVLADLDAQAVVATAAELTRAGYDARAVGVDVTDRDGVDAFAAAIVNDYGRVDIVAANAGIYPECLLGSVDDAFWDHVMAVNVKGALHIMQAFLPVMTSRQYGRVVMTSSITGPITGQAEAAAYGASKAAMLGFMRSAAIEVATRGITVNAVMPGNVRTPGWLAQSEQQKRALLAAIPIGRLADPEDIGWAVRFLASPEAAYITGQTLIVDGGQVLPEGAAI